MGIYRVQLKSSDDMGAYVSSFHVELLVDPEGDLVVGAQTLADKVDLELASKWSDLIKTTGAVDEIVVTQELPASDTTTIPAQYVKAVNNAGGYNPSTVPLSPALCGMLKFSTSAAIRSGHGRIFTPPIYSATPLDAEGGLAASGTWRDAAIAVRDEFQALADGAWDSEGIAMNFVVFSRKRFDLALDPAWFDVTAVSLSPRQHWLRSREPA